MKGTCHIGTLSDIVIEVSLEDRFYCTRLTPYVVDLRFSTEY